MATDVAAALAGVGTGSDGSEQRLSPELFRAEQRRDKELKRLFDVLGAKESTLGNRDGARAFRDVVKHLFTVTSDGMLVRTAGSAAYRRATAQRHPSAPVLHHVQLVVPRALVPALLKAHHDDALSAHEGVARMVATLQQRFWWRSMWSDCRAYVEACETCQRSVARPAPSSPEDVNPLPPPTRPWQRVHVDGAGPLPRSRNGNTYFLVVVDAFSKWAECVPLVDFTAHRVGRALIECLFARHEAPEIIVSDRGRQFVSEMFEAVCAALQIEHRLTTPYHPQANGQAEVVVGVITERIRRLSAADETQSTWDERIPEVLASYRFAPHSSTSISPYTALTGRVPVRMIDLAAGAHRIGERLASLDQIVERARRDVELVDRVVREQLQEAAGRMRREPLQRRKKARKWWPAVNDLVLVREHVTPVGLSPKLRQQWKPSPYRVLKLGVTEDGRHSGAVLLKSETNPDEPEVWHNVRNLKRFARSPQGQPQYTAAELREEGLYEVDKLLGHKWVTKGGERNLFVLVRWKGYSPRYDTWEPADHLREAVPECWAEYWRLHSTDEPQFIPKRPRSRGARKRASGRRRRGEKGGE